MSECHCPACGAKLLLSASGVTKSTRPGLFARRHKPDRYEFDVASVVPTWQSPPSVVPAEIESIERIVPVVGPETNTRAVGVPFKQTLIFGLGVIAFGGGIVIWTQSWSGWYVPGIVALMAAPLAGLGIFAYHNGLLRIKEVVHGFAGGNEVPEPVVPPVVVDLVEKRVTASGLKIQVSRPALPNPKKDGVGLAKFLYAVLAGQASFSERGGKQLKGAHHYGYTRVEWEELRKLCIRYRFIEDKGSERTVTTKGKQVFEAIALRDLGEVLSPIPSSDATGITTGGM